MALRRDDGLAKVMNLDHVEVSTSRLRVRQIYRQFLPIGTGTTSWHTHSGSEAEGRNHPIDCRIELTAAR